MRLKLVLVLLAGALCLPLHAQESVGQQRPGRPESVQFRKRNVTEAAVADLCTLSGGRECVVLNQTAQALCLKAPAADATCGSTTIDCTADTDMILVPAGGSWEQTLPSGGTLCGKLAAANAADCATPAAAACVYSAEAK